jgi:hypothetical protein
MLAKQIKRSVVLPFISVLPPDINVMMQNPQTRIELPFDAPFLQTYCQILRLV